MTINLPPVNMLLPASTPLVSRSPMVRDGEVIAIEGTQFIDGLRRFVAPVSTSDETILVLQEALHGLAQLDGRLRFITDLLTPTPEGTALAESATEGATP